MNNPWEKIDLDIYETHMSSDSVFQLQTLNEITRQQLTRYKHSKVAILGIAAGNGLENIDRNSTEKVYGFDVNSKYLDICKQRYLHFEDILELICCDLSDVQTKLPNTNILICNLIIEYLGIENFVKLIRNNKKNVEIISSVIQKNNNSCFVSSSNLYSAFDPILTIHNDINDRNLIDAFEEIEFDCIQKEMYPLPNGKELIRIDFSNNSKE